MNEIKKLFKSFTYAFSGIGYCIRHERNFRIHLTFLVYMFSILLTTDWFVLSKTDFAVLVIISALVISLELVNTAVENAVNLASKEHTVYGKIAKDTAAGAVLVSAIFSVIVGLIIMLQPSAFKAMFSYYTDNPLMFLILVLSLIPAFLFIFGINPISKEKNNE